MANVMIDIASEFTGKKAFKQAETSTEKLTKNVKQLAKTFGLAFGTSQVIAFGKASVKAAAADQKAQQQLALALKNVGLERDADSAESYIQRLQSEFGIVDDLLRPAYQSLAIATRDTAESQRLLNLSLDISAATGKDLGSVTTALSRAYLGNNTALTRLGVGISKADLKTKSFYEITNNLAETFKGSATAAAATFQGSMDKLAVASANVQEIIGTGLIDALTNLGDNNSVNDLAQTMEQAAEYTADVIRGVGVLAEKLKSLPGISSLNLGMIPILGSYLQGLSGLGQASQTKPKPFNTPMTISGQTQVKQQAQITKLTQQQAAAQTKITKDKKLQQAIDKANLALSKGEEIFDLDKIQIAAALTNQAEQLGKATSAAQVLQIANDTARLNVKRSILELEEAIASRDEQSVISATNKLNADLKILGALTGQQVKLQEIKSILDTLSSKSIGIDVDTSNAINKIKALYDSASSGIVIPVSVSGTAVSGTSGDAGAINIGGLYSAIGENFKEYLIQTNAITSGISPGGREFNYSITVNTGIGDPNAIADEIVSFLNDAAARGTLSNGLLTAI
jgi:hypothetical protein